MNLKYGQYKNAGLCVRCGAERDTSHTRCSTCHQAHLAYQQHSKLKAQQDGRCHDCLVRTRLPDKSTCRECTSLRHIRHAAKYASYKSKCFEAYGNKCSCCGNSNRRVLQLDHINNDGAEHRRELGWGRKGVIVKWAVDHNFPDRLQLLCANCHHIKTVYGGCTEEDHSSFTPQVSS